MRDGVSLQVQVQQVAAAILKRLALGLGGKLLRVVAVLVCTAARCSIGHANRI
jgi:hypothetical protein